MLTKTIKLSYWFGQLAEGLKNSAFSLLLLLDYDFFLPRFFFQRFLLGKPFLALQAQ